MNFIAQNMPATPHAALANVKKSATWNSRIIEKCLGRSAGVGIVQSIRWWNYDASTVGRGDHEPNALPLCRRRSALRPAHAGAIAELRIPIAMSLLGEVQDIVDRAEQIESALADI